MKKSNKKNIWVPGKPMTPKAREMLESGKGAMNSDGRWTCLECNRSLSNEWTLEQHIQTVHGARTFSCDVSFIWHYFIDYRLMTFSSGIYGL